MELTPLIFSKYTPVVKIVHVKESPLGLEG
jgi:hypothetical protein